MNEEIITRIENFAARSGKSESTIARKVFNDGKTLTRLRSGGQLTPRTQDKAMAALDALEREAAGPIGQRLTHLDRLEAESIHIMREVVAQCESPVMLYSVGKDSSVMLELAIKAFYPSPPPFPLLHVDTQWKFQEMYSFRDRRAKEAGMELITHINPEAIEKNVGPFSHGSAVHTDITKTQGLKQALDAGKFDAAFGGARRDEEKSRAKERIFSFRNEHHRWDAKINALSFGTYIMPVSKKAKVCGSSPSPIGRNLISGSTSIVKTSKFRAFTSQLNVQSSNATVD